MDEEEMRQEIEYEMELEAQKAQVAAMKQADQAREVQRAAEKCRLVMRLKIAATAKETQAPQRHRVRACKVHKATSRPAELCRRAGCRHVEMILHWGHRHHRLHPPLSLHHAPSFSSLPS